MKRTTGYHSLELNGRSAHRHSAIHAAGSLFAPGFFIKHIIKDRKIALECAEEMHLEMPGLQLAKRLYDQLSARGMEECGTQTLIQWYMKQ